MAAAVSCLLVPLLFIGVGSSSAAATTNRFSIVTNPGLIPAYNPKIQDYAIRCTGDPTTGVSTTGSGTVVVGGETFSGPVNLNVSLVADQSLEVDYGGSSYYIRCLPNDFPIYYSTVSGHPKAPGYLVTLETYAIAFDDDGVPVWWYDGAEPGGSGQPQYAEFLTPTTVAVSQPNSFELVGLDGTIQGGVGGESLPLDTHDLELLPNGNYLGIERVPGTADLSSWGLSSEAAIIDDDIVEFTPSGQVVWSWSTADHVNVAAENANWHDQYPDVIHMNSIQYDGNGGVIFSARHLDAVYRVDMATGAITWKLAGTPTPESLTIAGSRHPTNFSGQHYARLLPNGEVTVQDDGTRANRRVRAVVFKINTTKMTAKLVQQVTDPRSTPALCCGSAIKLPTGGWVASWGYNDYTTELSRTGRPVLTITYPLLFSYRAELVDASITALREGMDEQVVPLQLSQDSGQIAQTNEPLAGTAATTAASSRSDRAGHPRLHLRGPKS
ncbi:MAG: aryl-sulfate sulfotransferase [Acidimicrobiales bacterium]